MTTSVFGPVVTLDRLERSRVDSLERLLRYVGAEVPKRPPIQHVSIYRQRLALAAAVAIMQD